MPLVLAHTKPSTVLTTAGDVVQLASADMAIPLGARLGIALTAVTFGLSTTGERPAARFLLCLSLRFRCAGCLLSPCRPQPLDRSSMPQQSHQHAFSQRSTAPTIPLVAHKMLSCAGFLAWCSKPYLLRVLLERDPSGDSAHPLEGHLPEVTWAM